jgi:serine/threonine/tyrosine protein kinase RAD53
MMQPPSSPSHDDAIMAEYAMNDGLEQTQQTQQAQAGSQPFDVFDSHLWGFLQPCTGTLTRIDFWKANPVYAIGRNPEGNNIVLLGFKVSEYWSTFVLLATYMYA